MNAARFTPGSAVEAQDELARFMGSVPGVEFMAGIVAVRMKEGYSVACDNGPARAAFEVRTMLGARTYLVTSEMLAVAEHAARKMPPQAVMREDAPCPSGFVVFERGVMMPDVHGKMLAFAAFAWRVVVDSNGDEGIHWTYYGDCYDERDEYVAQASATDRAFSNTPRLLYIGEDGEKFGVDEWSAEEVAARHDADVENIREARVYMRRMPLALFALMQSEGVADVERAKADRGARRRLERARSPLTGDVVVVRLRRAHAHGSASEEHAREWSRRWIVSGHWRRQWYGTLKAHRLRWIAPFVKGPDDKPLVIPRRVHVLER